MSERLIVDWRSLKQMGWPYSRAQTWRLMIAGRFPRASKLGNHRNSHPVWSVKEVLEHFKAHGLKITDDFETPARE